MHTLMEWYLQTGTNTPINYKTIPRTLWKTLAILYTSLSRNLSNPLPSTFYLLPFRIGDAPDPAHGYRRTFDYPYPPPW